MKRAKRIAYGLKGGLSAGQLASIREQTLLVLDKVGIAVPHEEILHFLARMDGVRVEGARVHYRPDLVEKHIAMLRRENGDYTFLRAGEDEWLMRPAYMCLNSYDAIGGTSRRATSEDLRKAAKLCDYYGMVGTPPLHPQDVPDHLRQVNAARICIENSRDIGRWMMVKNEQEARCIAAMSRTAGRNPPYVNLQITISPLRLNTEYLAIIYRHRNDQAPLDGIAIGGGAIPMLGATGPLAAPAAWVQAAAEALAAYTTVKLIDERVCGVCSSNVFPFDMRRACMVIGSPEGLLARLMSFQISEFLFGYKKGATFGAMGMPLDAQSSAEKMGNVLLEALAGARVFYDAGMTPLDDLFCLEQVVCDREILRWVKRLVAGMDCDDDRERLLRTMEEGIDEETFLAHEATVTRHRDFYWEPELFRYETLAMMAAGGGQRSLPQRARDIAERDLARHAFALPADVQKEIGAIYGMAEESLRGLP